MRRRFLKWKRELERDARRIAADAYSRRSQDQLPHWYESPVVRGTLTALAPFGLAWTIYQIARQLGA